MPYFHATAVFEARGTSLEEADRTAAALFKSLHHNRIHYYEHDVTAGAIPSPSSDNLYFSVIAEFDVDAYNEERAGEFTDEVLESLATDDVQFIAFGLTQGEQRVRPPERAPQAERASKVEPASEEPKEARVEEEEPEERKGKKRSSRSRSRKRKGERESEVGREERTSDGGEEAAAKEAEGEESLEATPRREERTFAEPVAPVVITPLEAEQKSGLEIRPLVPEEEAPPAPPPPRSSTAMQVTLTMSFRASEFDLRPNDGEVLDRDELLARAIAEARSRHPELPPDVSPVHEFTSLPWGEVIVNLTWQYPVPVPSAADEVEH